MPASARGMTTRPATSWALSNMERAKEDGALLNNARARADGAGMRAKAIAALATSALAASAFVAASIRSSDRTSAISSAMSANSALGNINAASHASWRGMTMTSRTGMTIDLSPCREFALDVDARARNFSREGLNELRSITWIDGFWPSREGEEQHHALEYYARGVARTSCAAGAFGMNVMFAREDDDGCADALEAYATGVVFRGIGNENAFGRGAVRCVVKPREELRYAQMTKCGAQQYKRVWINKVPLVHAMAHEIETNDAYKELKSTHYFWLDADVGLLQCPEGVPWANSFCNQVGAPEYYRERVGFPPFKWVHETMEREKSQGKMMVNCYRNEFSGQSSKEAKKSEIAALAMPRMIDGACDDIHRISIVANMFGGTLHAVTEYNKAYMSFIHAHIPTARNGGFPAEPIECSCPTEENIMSSMAILENYKTLTSDNSCARQTHGQVWPVDTFKTTLVSEIDDEVAKVEEQYEDSP